MLSDGIADLLFTGSNRLETRTEVIKKKILFYILIFYFPIKAGSSWIVSFTIRSRFNR
jgi:hypothetical protein